MWASTFDAFDVSFGRCRVLFIFFSVRAWWSYTVNIYI
jgi:hypothetical protein